VRKIATAPFIALIYLYKYTISPLLPRGCRHYPTCSSYGVDALKTYGLFRGGMLTANRILRCHPWGTHGYDPVPHILIRKYRPAGNHSFTGKRYPASNRLKEHNGH
jgi:hypothetical protein